MRGRRTELAALDRVLAEVRAGRSQVLVLRGEAGVGKTVLLDYVQERASGCRVVRAAGVESEIELPFAVLDQLCAPMLTTMAGLPGPQRDALSTAFGLGAGRHRIASLSASRCSDCSPWWLRIGLSSARWMMRGGLTGLLRRALAFVARRLLAKSVAMVSLREPNEDRELTGLPELLSWA